MGKGQDAKKSIKKTAVKTLKEKRIAKKDKKMAQLKLIFKAQICDFIDGTPLINIDSNIWS